MSSVRRKLLSTLYPGPRLRGSRPEARSTADEPARIEQPTLLVRVEDDPFAARLLDSASTCAHIQELLDHASARTTLTCTHVTAGDLAEVTRPVDELERVDEGK